MPDLLTVGVEEEFLLVDQVSGETVPKAPAVLAGAVAEGPPGAAVHAELFASQVEAATGVCETLDDLRRHLEHGRRALGAAAAAQQAQLISTGTPVLSRLHPPITSDQRFDRVAQIFSGLLADYESCGCHVHVGVADKDTAVAVVNQLRRWLPTLLALSVNSPFHHGRDTGYASWRMVQQSRFPGSGVPPRFGSAAEYDEELSRLVDCGVLVDTRMTFWLARPSPSLPTVEVRAADASIGVSGAILQAALSRALVRRALSELDAGREAPAVRSPVAAAAVWSAMRYGPAGPAVDLLRERAVPAAELVEQLLAWVAEPLEDAGDLAFTHATVDAILHGGTGADQQRRAMASGGPERVVDMLAERAWAQPEASA